MTEYHFQWECPGCKKTKFKKVFLSPIRHKSPSGITEEISFTSTKFDPFCTPECKEAYIKKKKEIIMLRRKKRSRSRARS